MHTSRPAGHRENAIDFVRLRNLELVASGDETVFERVSARVPKSEHNFPVMYGSAFQKYQHSLQMTRCESTAGHISQSYTQSTSPAVYSGTRTLFRLQTKISREQMTRKTIGGEKRVQPEIHRGGYENQNRRRRPV